MNLDKKEIIEYLQSLEGKEDSMAIFDFIMMLSSKPQDWGEKEMSRPYLVELLVPKKLIALLEKMKPFVETEYETLARFESLLFTQYVRDGITAASKRRVPELMQYIKQKGKQDESTIFSGSLRRPDKEA